MLVLSRLRDETIMIGDDIQITIVDIRGDKVRLGISAPTRIAVHRKEVYESIKAENTRAAAVAGSVPDVLRQTLSLGPPRVRRTVSTRLTGLAPTARIRAPDLPGPAPMRIGTAAHDAARRLRSISSSSCSPLETLQQQIVRPLHRAADRRGADYGSESLSLNHGGLQWLGSIRISRA